MLSDTLVRTVSTQSESVDGQRCGHRANLARLKERKLNRIYPVLSFIFVVSIAYFRKIVCYSSGEHDELNAIYRIRNSGMQHTFPKTQVLVPVATIKKHSHPQGMTVFFWSKRQDSNLRSPVPEAIGSSLLTTFIYFLVLFSPKTMLSDTLVRTVSTQFKSVDGQRCGHRAICASLKA